MRIDGGDGRRHGHHGFERVAALGEDGAAGFDGGAVRCADDTAAMAGAMQVGHAPSYPPPLAGEEKEGAGSVKPRFFSSASALGKRPRNVL